MKDSENAVVDKNMEENIPEYPQYHISRDGKLFSLKRGAGKWRQLHTAVDVHGYEKCQISKNGRSKYTTIHSLMAVAYLGPRPEKYQVCHNDGNRLNNIIENLRYDTVKNNHADKIKHGTKIFGERHPDAVLKECDIIPILNLISQGVPVVTVAKNYSISPGAIVFMLNRHTWGHVKIPNELIEKVNQVRTTWKLKNLSPQEILEMFLLKANGKSVTELSKMFSVSKARAAQVLRNREYISDQITEELFNSAQAAKVITKYSLVLSEEQTNAMVGLREIGMGYVEIAQKFNISYSSARKVILQSQDVPIQSERISI